MGIHTEKTYREAFSKEVDWAKIDEEAIFRIFSNHSQPRNNHIKMQNRLSVYLKVVVTWLWVVGVFISRLA